MKFPCQRQRQAMAGLARSSAFAHDGGMKTRSRRLLILVLVSLLALAGYVAAGPWLAVNGIRHLVASGQTGELWRFVDYAQLRDNLRPQIREQIARGVLPSANRIGSGKRMADVIDLLAKPTLDAMASPQGVATLLTGSSLGRRAGLPQGAPNDPLADAETHYESASLFTASVPNADGDTVVFEFRRSGLGWKLTGLRLPAH